MSVPQYSKMGLACLFFLASILPLASFAQEQRNQTNLGDVLVRFCNDEDANVKGGTKTLELEADTGTDTEVCMYVSNTGPNDVEVLLNFVDGTVTSDTDQKKACQPEGTKGNFGQYVTMEETTLPIAAGKTIQTYAAINFPAGVAGMKYGCVTSQIVGQNESDSGMFKIVSRRANFIDVLVNGRIVTDLTIVPVDTSLGNLATSNEILVVQDPLTDEYFAKITVKNGGNVAQQVDITPNITTRFQEPVAVNTMSKKVLPGSSETFQFVLDEYIPLWQGNVGIDMTLSHTAVIDFESDAVTAEHKKTVTKHIVASFFVVPWLIIIGILILLVLLWIVANKGSSETISTKDTRRASGKKAVSSKKKIKSKTGKDDLTKIEGIGPKVQSILRKAGIDTYAKLANSKIGDIRDLLTEHNLARFDPKHRKKQATLAKNGKRDDLKAFQKTI